MKSIIISLRIVAVLALMGSPLLLGWLLDNFTGFPIEVTLGGIGFALFFIGFLWDKENAMGIGCVFILYLVLLFFFGPALMAKLRLASQDVRASYYSVPERDTLLISGPTKNKVTISIWGKKMSAQVRGKDIYLDNGDIWNYSESYEPINSEKDRVHGCINGHFEGQPVSFCNQYIRFIPPPSSDGWQSNI